MLFRSVYVTLTYEYLDDAYFKENNILDSLAGDGIVIFNKEGEEIWGWNIFDHVDPFSENYVLREDWSHANAISVDTDGHFLISFRNFDQIWKIHSFTGEIIWRLGLNGDFNLNNENIKEIQFEQNKIDLLIEHYSKINFFETDFELVTYLSKKEKFRNNGVIQVEKSNFKILIDDVVYAHYDNKFYTISSTNKELTILNIENNERITDESILFKINPLSFLKKFRENNNIVFEETNNRYIIRYILEQEKYNLFFEKNLELVSTKGRNGKSIKSYKSLNNAVIPQEIGRAHV